jgi:hypothetical protein
MTDHQSQQRINEAAEQFTDALVQSYKVVAERGVSAQEGSAQVTEVFFNQAINNLRAQAEENRQATQRLADQQQRQAEATRTITQESVGAYLEFIGSMYFWWLGDVKTAEQGARETEKAEGPGIYLRNCPKRGSNDAPSVNLAGLRRAKWTGTSLVSGL